MSKQEKKRIHNEKIIEFQHGISRLLIMSTNSGFEKHAKNIYSRKAELTLLAWIERKIAFSLINSIGLFLQGSR